MLETQRPALNSSVCNIFKWQISMEENNPLAHYPTIEHGVLHEYNSTIARGAHAKGSEVHVHDA